MKSRGRPKMTDEQKKSRNMTFRTRGGMREKLAAAAAANGRSISEEIEVRLTRSFEIQKNDELKVAYAGLQNTQLGNWHNYLPPNQLLKVG